MLGRKDADMPDSEGRVLKGDASAEEVKVPAPLPVAFEISGAGCFSGSYQSRSTWDAFARLRVIEVPDTEMPRRHWWAVQAWFESFSAPAGGGPFSSKSKFWPRVSYVLWTAAHPDADQQLGNDPDYASWKKK